MVEVAERPSFVGRAAELSRLIDALDRASAGEAGTVIVGGEAGIGKTRLIAAFRDLTERRGALTLEGACLELGTTGLPYAPFVEALRTLVRSSDPGRLPALLGPTRHELARLLPELDPRAGDGAQSGEFDRTGQSRLFESVLNVVERLARPGPAVLVVEDLHWADQSTRDLLGFLIRNLRSSAVLFVVTARSDELRRRHPVLPFLAELEREESVDRIELRPFDRPELAEQVAYLLDRAPEPDVVDRIFERTDGNPFFVEQLIEAAGEEALSADAPDLPPQLRDVLLARIGALDDGAQELLRAAAAAGRRTDDALLARVLGLPDRAVASALREVVGRGILVEARSDGTEGGFAFHHALLRDIVYSELFAGERLQLHRAFAQALRERGEIGGVPVGAADLAYHWDAAHEYAEALPALVEAARAAEGAYAFTEAARLYERALELWDRVPDADGLIGDRVSLLERVAEVSVLLGAHARAIAAGREAIAALAEAGQGGSARAGYFHERLRWYLWEAGDRRAAAEAVREAIRLIPRDPPTAARARALAQLAGVELHAGRIEEAAAAARAAIDLAEASGSPRDRALGLGVLGWCEAVLGDVDRGVETYRKGLDIAVELQGVEGISLAYAELARLFDAVGRTEDSLAAAREGFEIARRLGLERTYGGVMLGHAAKALIALGRWQEASAALAEALGRRPTGLPAIALHVLQARLDANQARFDRAADEVRRAALVDDELGGTHRAPVLAARAELAAMTGDVAAVRVAVDEAWQLVRDETPPDPALAWLAALAFRAEADAAERARARRDDRAVAEARARARAIAQRSAEIAATAPSSSRGTPPTGRVIALRALFRAELGRLDGGRDPESWVAVATAWDAIGRPYPAAYARFREAEAHLAGRGSRDAAQGALRWAWRVADRLEAVPLRREIELLARQAGLEVRPIDDGPSPAAPEPSPTASLGLTAREEEVLRLVAGGWSNQQIGDHLFISRKTASVHVSNILGKLGVSTRVEAAAVAHRLGLAEDAPPPPGSE